jgi:uncharacterized protein (TIGR02246 family)
MNDYEAIRRLLAIYALLLDARRLREWGELFSEDALFLVFGRTLRGRAEIVAAVGGMQPKEALKHAVLQPVIELVDVDRARAWTDFSVMLAAPDGAVRTTNFATYHDRLRKHADGRWRIAQRAIVAPGDELPPGVDPLPTA